MRNVFMDGNGEECMRIIFAFAVVVIVFLSGCTAYSGRVIADTQEPAAVRFQSVSFLTEDGFELFGSVHLGNKLPIILLHELGRDRGSWRTFGEELARRNYTVLAIDLRGHGQSVYRDGERIGWTELEDFLAIARDIRAAKGFLETTVGMERYALVGASIGGNLALRWAASDPTVAGVAMLSPGLDYRGVTIMDALEFYQGRLLLMASTEDVTAAESARQVYQKYQGEEEIKLYSNAGHGTDLLKGTDGAEILLAWLEKV